MNIVKSILKFFIKTKAFAGSQNIIIRKYFRIFFQYIFYFEYKKRVQLGHSLKSTKELPEFSESKGFFKLDNFEPELIAEILKAGQKIKAETDFNDLYNKSSNKHLVSFTIPSTGGKNNPFLKLAMHPSLIKMISNYIGMLPVIENIMFWYSPNKANLENSSQLYHLDGQDTKTIQLFLYLDDVDLDSGPLTLVEASESERIAIEHNYRKTPTTKRISDEFIAANVPREKIHTFNGPAGSIFIADTDRCFHYGSRSASKPRYIIAFQYYTPFAFALPWRWWKKLPYANVKELSEFNPTERLIMGSTH
jgi:hypothetical protein